MVAHSPKLIKYVMGALEALEKKDRVKFDQQLAGMNETYECINGEMELMWGRSLPEDYVDFRTFIMGTKNQVNIYINYEQSKKKKFKYIITNHIFYFFYFSLCSLMV